MREALGVETVYGRHVSHDFSRHTHKTLCIGIVEQGVRIFLCRGERYEVAAGGIFIIPPDEAHSCISEGTPHTYRLLLISPDLFNMILPTAEDNNSLYIFRNLVIDDQECFSQLLNLHTVLKSSETKFVKQSVLIAATGNVVEHCVARGKDLKISNKQYESVKRVQTYIENHFAACFSLEDIAKEAYLSPYYLIRVFSQINGIPPHIYLQQVRIRHAKQMLIQGVPIADVALRTGFGDQSHFSNVFKRMVGISPGEYTRSLTVLE
ncbi:MAG: transcriptional regulator, AraC family [Firmicutes bacterium]|nr:transcriptional regulator, AraC family [Bacillota bacterium]